MKNQVVEISRLNGCESFICTGNRHEFAFNVFIIFDPVKRIGEMRGLIGIKERSSIVEDDFIIIIIIRVVNQRSVNRSSILKPMIGHHCL